MYNYKAPLTDMNFLLQLDHHENSAELGVILAQAAKFVEQEMAPINALGDQQGCRFDQGEVTLPAEFKTALSRYKDAGWMGATMEERWGGQELPAAVGALIGEMMTSANQAMCMFSALTMSACKAIMAFGSAELQQQYLPKMVSGEWTGTMCMTEAHCGSDLGLIKTSATAIDETTFKISGTKIFISAGEHNGSDNIIHLVLARIKSSPGGVKGLSLFLVPKRVPHPNQDNAVSCIGIEEKMGIHANPTCTMSFEGATGYLVGRPNEGIKAMFTMMNEMRLGTALQGVGMSEQAFQKSFHYARERIQGKTLDRAKKSDAIADPLIEHVDIRRMLFTQKAFAEGGRALCQYCAGLLDITKLKNGQQLEAEKLLGLLTPIAKAFLTETGLESASHAIQVYGGHGFVRESGVEQIYRDGRIATLYEGTTGIQALDLLGRKVLGDQAQTLLVFTKLIYQLCKTISDDEASSNTLKSLSGTLMPYTKDWPQLAQQIGMKALQDHEEVGAAAYDFLMYSGYITLAYFWLKQAYGAATLKGEFNGKFIEAKIKTAEFFFEKLLPRAQTHKAIMLSGKRAISSLETDEWLF